MNILSYIIVGIFYGYGLISLYITFLAKKKGEKGAFYNNLINSFIFIISITINILIVNLFHLSNVAFIVFPFDIFLIIFIILFIPLFYLMIYREKRKMKVKNMLRKESSALPKELPFKYEIYRKLTHLIVLQIIFFYFTLGFYVQNIFVYILEELPDFFSELFFSIYNIEANKMIFTQYLVVFLVGISLIGLFTADFIRILKPKIYPLKPVNRILREKELHIRLGPHISTGIGCFSIIILFGLFQPIGPLIICVSMTMAIFGDMTSNLFGRTFGRKRIRNTSKTYEGLFTGMAVAFISGVILLILLREFIFTNIIALFLLPIIGSLIIGILDYLDLVVDDNLTYIFTLSTVLFFISIFII